MEPSTPEKLVNSEGEALTLTPDAESEDQIEEYGKLDPEKVHSTVKALSKRIRERFPDSGLSRICTELKALSRLSQQTVDSIHEPIWTLRLSRYTLLGVILSGLLFTVFNLDPQQEEIAFSIFDFIQTLEAGINDVVLISVAVYFIWSLESRVKRRRALKALHKLRSIAHVIDMHQLTKDPDRILVSRDDTESSPKMKLSAFGLRRYLDYCSEMLSLTGKVAAIYLEKLDDPTVVVAVNEIEDLTTGLSRKIWQKIDMLRDEEA